MHLVKDNHFSTSQVFGDLAKVVSHFHRRLSSCKTDELAGNRLSYQAAEGLEATIFHDKTAKEEVRGMDGGKGL